MPPAIQLTLQFDQGRLHKVEFGDALAFSVQITGKPDPKELALLEEFIEQYKKKNWKKLPNLSAFFSERYPPFTPFQRKVLHAMQQVAPGSTLSYGALAEEVGRARAARAVGTVCHLNPFPFFIPCHRIIGSNGALRGFAYNIEIKKKLLSFESN